MTLTASLVQVAEQEQRRTQAGRLRTLAEDRLTAVHARIEAGEAARLVGPGSSTATLPREPAVDLDQLDPQLRGMVDRIRGGQTTATEATRSPVPNPLEKAPDHTIRPSDADRGLGR